MLPKIFNQGKDKETFTMLRILNSTKSCVLLRKFKGVNKWSFPIDILEKDTNVVTRILEMVNKHVSGTYEFVSALNILEYTSDLSGNREYTTIAYDIKYSGKVFPTLPECNAIRNEFDDSKWQPVQTLSMRNDLNFATKAYIEILRKNPCL